MEKFAVDLDKVLDDFEFNEDCAEQIASVSSSKNNASSSTVKCNLESPNSETYNYHLVDSRQTNKEFDIISSLERYKNTRQIDANNECIIEKDTIPENINCTKEETIITNIENINQFHTQDCVNDNKVITKQLVSPFDSSQVLLTVGNNISQKVIQKQQTDNSSLKTDNTYDKKLNQFNLKPSVSNVFSSLNEYINAPPGSSDFVQPILNEHKVQSNENEASQLIQNSLKDSDKIIMFKQTTDITRESSISNSNVSITSETSITQEDDIKEHIVKNVHATNLDESNTEVMSLKEVTLSQIHVASNSKVEIVNEAYNCNSANVHEGSDIENQENSPLPGNSYTQTYYCERNSTLQSEKSQTRLNVENYGITDQHEYNSSAVHKPIGFSNIDNLSEDQLTKYLTELEEEEKLNKESNKHENVALCKPNEVILMLDQVDKGKSTEQVFKNLVIESPKMAQKELNCDADNISVIDCRKEDVHTKILTNVLQEQNEEYKDNSISNNISRKDLKLLHTLEDTNMEQENICVISDNKCLPHVKCTKDNQEHCMYNLSINQSLQSNSKVEIQLKEPNENSMQYNEISELKVQNDIVNVSEERRPMTSEMNTLNNKIIHCNDIVPTLMETTTRQNVNDTTDESEKPVRPQTLDILTNNTNEHQIVGSTNDTPLRYTQSNIDDTKEDEGSSPETVDNSVLQSNLILGKQPPLWVPDSEAPCCMLCDVKFTVMKRRHHCRACGKVLCNKCCNMKYKLEYQGNINSRVCVSCYQLLIKAETEQSMGEWSSGYSARVNNEDINSPQGRQPNPNNPMEYCSTIPPLQQLAGGLPPPPTVMVPVGVLKRERGTKNRPEVSKSVMFSDGIRPGCDLTELDISWDLNSSYCKPENKRLPMPGSSVPNTFARRQNLPRLDPNTESYVSQDPNILPPTVTIHKGQMCYHAVTDEDLLYKTLKNECEPPLMFAVNRNLFAYIKILTLNCCVNKTCWNVTSKGLACVGQDEIILLVEVLPEETKIPKDLLIFINQLYLEAIKGNTVSELGFSIYQGGNFLNSREHAGFLFIRQTLQCLQKIVLPPAPFLIGLLVHRWETPWAKVFPLRLVLRLGAEYRYYPCPLFSVRFRDALYFEIGHTVMKVLADFRNFGYTLPGVRGLTIHLRNRMTDVMFPKNRYDQVIKGLNNSNDHVLAYASNFSISADSHLVCMQNNTGDESSYQTQAISINNKPRTVTGTSFIVINGALKSSMGLSAKSSIVEDGLMVEIMPEKMEALKAALKNMQDFSIGCGRQGALEPDETVNIKWVDNDLQFNLGVKSPIDGQPMDGIPSIRVHNGTDYKGTSRFIRWTEVFIIKSDDHPNGVHDPVDINKLSGNIAKATCTALVKLLDLLANAGLTKLGVRTTVHPDNVGYEAGSEGMKLPPIYMNSLDDELIQVLHKAAQSSQDTHTVLELIFYVLDD